MERTGHRSVEGVCSYKRTSDAQHEAISDIMNGKNDKADVTGVSQVAPVPTTTHGHNTNLNFSLPAQSAALCSQPPSTVSSSMLSASHLYTTLEKCTVNFYVAETSLGPRKREEKGRKRKCRSGTMSSRLSQVGSQSYTPNCHRMHG